MALTQNLKLRHRFGADVWRHIYLFRLNITICLIILSNLRNIAEHSWTPTRWRTFRASFTGHRIHMMFWHKHEQFVIDHIVRMIVNSELTGLNIHAKFNIIGWIHTLQWIIKMVKHSELYSDTYLSSKVYQMWTKTIISIWVYATF